MDINTHGGSICRTEVDVDLCRDTYEAVLEWRVDEVGRSSLSGRILLRTPSVPRVLDQLGPGQGALSTQPQCCKLIVASILPQALWFCRPLVMVAHVGGLLSRSDLDDSLLACSHIERTLLLT
jgi:hypothetical protein